MEVPVARRAQGDRGRYFGHGPCPSQRVAVTPAEAGVQGPPLARTGGGPQGVADSGFPLFERIPAFRAVKELKLSWTSAVRPSRRPRSLSSGRPKAGPVGGLLRMRDFLNAIKDLPHPEERPRRVSKDAPL